VGGGEGECEGGECDLVFHMSPFAVVPALSRDPYRVIYL
jgi:hypothetical protein